MWAKALGSSGATNNSYDSNVRGINFTGVFGEVETFWYPASGHRKASDGRLGNVSYYGYYWSCSLNEDDGLYAYGLFFSSNGSVDPSYNSDCSDYHPVRCLQVTDEAAEL